jgi:thiol-disulfide isomerase/thioredoxin
VLNLLVALSLAVPIPALIPTAEAPFQDLSFDQALAAAKKGGKVVMIDFFTTWCQPCKRLDSVTWKDPEVQKWLGETAVALKIDAEKEVQLAQRFGVVSYPTITFVKADGQKIDAIIGFKPPQEFLSIAKDLLAGKSAVSRAKEALAGHENDPMKRQDYAKELLRAGKYDEALAEYLWCFDHGNDEPKHGYGGVRLSFLLGDIKRLGQDYPPAIKALEERRDAAEAAVLAGKDTSRNAIDMTALNRELGQKDRNLAVYDRLKKENRLDAAAKIALVDAVAPQLVEARRYADLLADAGDVEQRVRQEIETVRRSLSVPTGADPGSVKALQRSQAMYASTKARELGLWYEALLGGGKTDTANHVLDQLLEFAPTGATYAGLVDRALHAEAPEAARAIVERGRAALVDNEKAFVEAAARKIPAAK